MMEDNDVVFLGRSLKPTHRPVMGLALHVEKNGDTDAHILLFKKVDSMVVHIGRRPANEQGNQEPALATFRCAVVSRKHAKIAFSDSGHVYVIDLHSHHGTHIRRPSDKFSKMIKPETPTILSEGDTITFGKSVGKGNECVRPIVGKVELLFDGWNPTSSGPPPLFSSFAPLVVPSNEPNSPESLKSFKFNSGRYGIHTTSASSASSSPSSSDANDSKEVSDSDVQEISPPPDEIKPLESSMSQGKELSPLLNAPAHLFAFNVLRRFLPPSNSSFPEPSSSPPPLPPSRILPSVSEIVERPLAHMSSFFWRADPEPDHFRKDLFDSSAPIASRPFREDCRSPIVTNLRAAWRWDNEELDRYPDSTRLPPSEGEDMEESEEEPAEKNQKGKEKEKERSNSPMDLASPSPAAEVIVSGNLSIPPSSPRPELPQPISSETSMSHPRAGSSTPSPLPDPCIFPSAQAVDPVMASPQASTTSTTAKFREMKGALDDVRYEVSKLHTHRRKYKARFNSNVHVMSNKMLEWEERIGKLEDNLGLDSSESSAATPKRTFAGGIDDKFMSLDGKVIGLDSRLDGIDAQLMKIDEKFASLEEKFNSYDDKPSAMDEKLANVDESMESYSDRLDELNAECGYLANQLEREKTERERLGEEVGDLEERMCEVEGRLDLVEVGRNNHADSEAKTPEVEELKGKVEELKSVIDELKAFKDAAEKNLQEEITSIRAKHEEDIKVVREEVERVRLLYEKQRHDEVGTMKAPVQTSLKRKRDDTDENVDIGNAHDDYIDEFHLREEPAVPDAMHVDETGSFSDEGPQSNLALVDSEYLGLEERGHEHSRPRKRARRIVSVVAQTATAVTIGAMVTWGALAFS